MNQRLVLRCIPYHLLPLRSTTCSWPSRVHTHTGRSASAGLEWGSRASGRSDVIFIHTDMFAGFCAILQNMYL